MAIGPQIDSRELSRIVDGSTTQTDGEQYAENAVNRDLRILKPVLAGNAIDLIEMVVAAAYHAGACAALDRLARGPMFETPTGKKE